MPDTDPDRLLAVACDVLDRASSTFVGGLGADREIDKGPKDFATAVDLSIERSVAGELADRTGIAVHGEEFGGPDVESGRVWVLDPVDGTANYSAGLPTAGILLALLDDGVPVLGLTWLPLLGRRYAARVGGPLVCNGRALPQLAPARLADSLVGVGSFNVASRGRIPGTDRLDLIAHLSRTSSRVRMHGSTGVDLAFVASGALGAAVVFGHHVWDNAAGVALVRAAGGVVTDLAGAPWTVSSGSVLAAAPGVHDEIRTLVDQVPGLVGARP